MPTILNIIFEVRPYVAGTGPKTIRMASAYADDTGTQLDGLAWEPLIVSGPTYSFNYTSDQNGLLTESQTDLGTLQFRMGDFYDNEEWSTYDWNNASCRIWIGELGKPFSAYRKLYEATTSGLERDGVTATVALRALHARLERPLLNRTYAGTGGAEGATGMKGKVKPIALGTCLSVEPVIVDAARWIYQVHGYGAVQDISAVYDFAQPLAALVASVQTYQELADLKLTPGQWAKCNPLGMFRLGGASDKKISADVQGGIYGGQFPDTVADIVPAILREAGFSAAQIGPFASLPNKGWSYYGTSEATVGEVARKAVLDAGGYLFTDNQGVWQVGNAFAIKPVKPLLSDGSAEPSVGAIKELNVADPLYQFEVGYDPCWGVHSDSDISPKLLELAGTIAEQDAALEAIRDTADLAKSQSDAATIEISNMVSDGVLDRSEKVDLQTDLEEAAAQRREIASKIGIYNAAAEWNVYVAAHDALVAFVTGLSPSITDTGVSTPVDRATFRARWAAYHEAHQAVLNAMTGDARTVSTWAGTTGSGKPEDNATVGAPDGTYVGSQPATQLVADAADAKGKANTAVDALKDSQGNVRPVRDIMAEAKTASDIAVADAKKAGTDAQSQVSQARTDLGKDITAAKAEGTTARQEAAKVRTDLVPTISDAKKAGTDAAAAAGRVSTDLATEVSRAKGAEGTLTTKVETAQGRADAAHTAISTETTQRTDADSALGQRIDTLTTTVGGNTTAISTEVTARTDGDNALGQRIDTLTTTVGGNTTKITDETKARSDADEALGTRATNLESTVNTGANRNSLLRSDISSEATTRATADTALATRATTLESKVGNNGAVNANPAFASYTASTGTPDGWTYDNQTNGGATRVAGETGGYAVQLASAANAQAYAAQTLGPIAANTWWVVEADVKLTAGTLAGAGVLFRIGSQDINLVFATDKDTTDTVVGAGTVGRIYRFRKLVQVTQTASTATFYYMSHWSGLGSIAAANTIVWYRNALRPASSAEIAAQRADTNAAAALSKITTEETTRSDADRALANRATVLETTVNSGTDGNTALKSRISTEETTRSDADKTLANRATALESSVNDSTKGNAALLSRIGIEETTRSDANVTLANRATTLESQSNSTPANSLNANPMFTAWPATQYLPTGWGVWVMNGSVERGASENNAPGTNAILYKVVANQESGLQAPHLYTAAGWYVLEAEVYLQAGTYYGSGITLGGALNLDFAREPDINGVVSATGPSRRKFTKLVNASGPYNDISLHPMANWSGFGQRDAKEIFFNRCAIRPATDGEIKAQKADAALNAPTTGVIARLTTEETTRSDADKALANRATVLEGTVNDSSKGNAALVSRISTEETTRATADNALATRSATLETTAARAGYINRNANFSIYPDDRASSSYPYQFTDRNYFWRTTNRVAGRVGKYAMQTLSTGMGGPQYADIIGDGSDGLNGVGPGSYIVDVDLDCLENYGPRGLGVEVHFQNAAGGETASSGWQLWTTPDAAGIKGEALGPRRWALPATAPAGTTKAWLRVIFGDWGSSLDNKNQRTNWHLVGLRLASDPDLRGRITTEETTRSDADKALANRALALESTVNNGITGVAATYAKVSTEETTRSDADRALSNRLSTTESKLSLAADSELYARIRTEETTRATADNSIAQRTAYLESTASLGAGVLNANPNFTAYPDGADLPSYWQWWATNGHISHARAASEAFPGYAVRINSGSSDLGFAQMDANGPDMIPGWYVMEADVRLESGSWRGSGVTIQGVYSLDFARESDTSGSGPNDSYIGRRRFTKLVKLTNGYRNWHPMTNWSGFAPMADKQMVWYRCAVRPASDAEIQAGKATTDISTLTTRIQTEETTRANAINAVASRTTVVEAQVTTDGNNLVRNPTFNAPGWTWQTYGVPAYWNLWAKDNDAYIGTSDRRSNYGAQAPLQIDRNGNNNGISQNLGTQAAGWYVLEADITAEDGNWTGCGVHINFNNGYSRNFHFGAEPDTNGGYVAGNIGSVNRKFSTMFYNRAVGTNVMFYLMAGWEGFATGQGFLRTIWHRACVRPATDAEIKAQKVSDANLIARVTTNESAVANVQTKVATAWSEKTVSAGTSAATIMMRAVDDNGNATSDVTLAASRIALRNTESGGISKGGMVMSGGNAVFDGSITANGGILVGNGKLKVQVQAQDYAVSHGQRVDFGYDLGRAPNITFGPCPVSLNSGEVYAPYASDLSSTGFTAQLVINSAPQTSGQSTGAFSNQGNNTWDGGKQGKPNAANGQYTLSISLQATATAYRDNTDYR